MFTRWKFLIWLTVITLAFASLAAASLGGPVAHAQGDDNDHVDVAVTLEFPDHIATSGEIPLNIVVVNHGYITAYDVEVVVNIVDPENSSHFEFRRVPPKLPVGSARLENNGYSLRWSIPALGGLQGEEFTLNIDPVRLASEMIGPEFDDRLYPHEVSGKVTTSSFQSVLHEGNDESRAWAYIYQLPPYTSFRQVGGNYSVAVSVDEPSPSPGDTVNFTITADKDRVILGVDEITGTIDVEVGHISPPIDLEVAIELTGGLSVASTPAPTYVPASPPASVVYSNGVFNIGTLKMDDPQPPTYSVTLPIRVRNDAVVNEQCLTATLTANPPPGPGPRDDDVSDNVAELCLGDQPVEPFVSGQVDAFTIYPYVSNTDPPCDNTDDVRVRAVSKVATTPEVIPSGKALVHALDRPNRRYDSSANSVNAGTKVSWQIPVIWNGERLNAVHAQWSNSRDTFIASGINGGSPPGRVHIRAFEDPDFTLIYKMTPDTTPPVDWRR